MGGYTKGPWVVSEYSDTGGYDCMTGGIQAGPVTLDGADYGQEWCAAENETCPPQMMADARLIAAAPELLEALQGCLPRNVCLTNTNIPDNTIVPLDVTMGELRKIAAAIAKATA